MQGFNPNRWLDYSTGDTDELFDSIEEGEHQEQDFKFRIDSSQKIAKTLCAFANTDGGKLLIGVKDNGRVSGIDPEEEYFMIEGAATLYCKPPIPFKSKVYQNTEKKLVLEIEVPTSKEKPHLCKLEEDRWRAYIRQKDENFEANRVILNYLKHQSPTSKRKNLIAYGPEERLLFDYLSANESISLSKFSRLAKISIYEAERILILFLQWEIITFKASDKGIRFFLL